MIDNNSISYKTKPALVLAVITGLCILYLLVATKIVLVLLVFIVMIIFYSQFFINIVLTGNEIIFNFPFRPFFNKYTIQWDHIEAMNLGRGKSTYIMRIWLNEKSGQKGKEIKNAFDLSSSDAKQLYWDIYKKNINVLKDF